MPNCTFQTACSVTRMQSARHTAEPRFSSPQSSTCRTFCIRFIALSYRSLDPHICRFSSVFWTSFSICQPLRSLCISLFSVISGHDQLLFRDKKGNFALREFDNDDLPTYAILFHTWILDNSQEVTFDDHGTSTGEGKAAYRKLLFTEEKAKSAGLKYF